MSLIKVTKSFNTNTPSWKSILDNFNYSVVYKNEIKFKPTSFFVSHDAHLIDEVKNVLAALNLNAAHLYLNFAVEKNTFGRHKDEDDVWFWQVQGMTRWQFDNEKHILEPGDLIYVPKHIYHNVTPLTPRAGISMSL
jgi:ribosomal protein L16 Arg81 hydroxylase